jgi:hypothetical protein
MRSKDKQQSRKSSEAQDWQLLFDLSIKKAELEEEVRQLQAALLIYAEIERRSSMLEDSVVSLLPCA